MTPLGRSFVVVGLVSPFLLPVVFQGPSTCCSQRASNERNASATLKALHTAQEDFRDNDRDGDGKRSFWRADVAGLYGLLPKDSNEAIKLIEVSTAGADLAPVEGPCLASCEPRGGYGFAALRFEDEAVGKLDPDRFAFCAVPASPTSGKFVYAITHDRVLWRTPAPAGRWIPYAFPLAPASAGWTSVP